MILLLWPAVLAYLVEDIMSESSVVISGTCLLRFLYFTLLLPPILSLPLLIVAI